MIRRDSEVPPPVDLPKKDENQALDVLSEIVPDEPKPLSTAELPSFTH